MNSDTGISYFSLTASGSLLALKLSERFGGAARLPRSHSLGCGHCSPFDDLAEALPERFRAGDTVVCVMAAGIVMRLLAPHLTTKQDDPAVIVIDEGGSHVIPLLGGHAAGANKLAREIAVFLDAKPAITTASDVQGLVAPDEVAKLLGAVVADTNKLREVAALLVNGESVCIESAADPGIEDYGWVAPGACRNGYAGRLLVTPFAGDGEMEEAGSITARLIPRVVKAGLGCRRGTASAEIIEAIETACSGAAIDPRSISTLASVTAKQDEAGLAAAARELGAGLLFYSPAELSRLGRPGSDFVAEQVGTPAVSEPAALMAAGNGARLLAGKTAYGPVTVALAMGAASGDQRTSAAASAEPSGNASATGLNADEVLSGRVMVVGTGAGTAPLLTEEAAACISAADVVIGYRTYIDQMRKIFPAKKFISGSMGKEKERCLEALAMANSGQVVALISSGDPGVYGMAGLILELADGIEVTVAPGVTAAQLAAARLGAPLMNDYITLSLSDLLTPRNEVLRRVEAAAASDMVICLYNPTSRKRQPLFEEACRLLEQHRPAGTIVGWVRDAGGPDEEAALIKLSELSAQDIDMRCIVIVGNSSTEVIKGRMVTRRGYI